MQLSIKQKVVNYLVATVNMRKVKAFLFWGGMILNLIIYINLSIEQSKLADETAVLHEREYKVSEREESCSLAESYIYQQGNYIHTSMNNLNSQYEELKNYSEYIKTQADDLNKKVCSVNKQIECLNTEADILKTFAEEVYSSDKLYIPTPQEIETLNKLVYAEAGNQSYEGKVAVAEVVFNRVESSSFPNNINDVIFAKSQFSPCYDGKTVRLGNGKAVSDEDVSDEIKKAVIEAWSGSNITETMSRGISDSSYWKGGALYFANPTYVVNDTYKAQILSSSVKINIEDHIFRRK